MPFFEDLTHKLKSNWKQALLFVAAPGLAITVAAGVTAGKATLRAAGASTGAAKEVGERLARTPAAQAGAAAGAAAGAVATVTLGVLPEPTRTAVRVASCSALAATRAVARTSPAFQAGRAVRSHPEFRKGEAFARRGIRKSLDVVDLLLYPIPKGVTRSVYEALRSLTPPLLLPWNNPLRALGIKTLGSLKTLKKAAAARAAAQAEEAQAEEAQAEEAQAEEAQAEEAQAEEAQAEEAQAEEAQAEEEEVTAAQQAEEACTPTVGISGQLTKAIR